MSWAIFQEETGAADGWYFKYETALEMLEFYRSEKPHLSHQLVAWGDPLTAKCREIIWAGHKIYDGLWADDVEVRAQREVEVAAMVKAMETAPPGPTQFRFMSIDEFLKHPA